MMQSRPAQPQRPLFVYNREGEIAQKWMAYVHREHRDALDFLPTDEATDLIPDIREGEVTGEIYLVEPDRTIYSGAGALFRALFLLRQFPVLFLLYRYLPGARWCADSVFKEVNQRPQLAQRLFQRYIHNQTHRSSYTLTSWIFFRLLGFVCLFAFVSLYVQIPGLIGSEGILPAASQLEWIQSQLSGVERYTRVPTLFWLIGSSDSILQTTAVVGIVCSFLLMVGVVPLLSLATILVVYLSFQQVGGPFLGFQWDALLLETCFVALFLAPWRVFHRPYHRHLLESMNIWLFWALIFKLMFSAGLVKWLSGDLAWREFTALEFHFFTQPIPTWTSYYAHYLPNSWVTVAVIVVLVIELAVPFLIFCGRYCRYFAALCFIGLQLVILMTGNYGYFNLLTIVLCLWLFDDRWWRRITPAKWDCVALSRWSGTGVESWARRITAPIIIIILVASTSMALTRIGSEEDLPWPFRKSVDVVRPFRVINAYGLFAMMTKERPEIIVEGSHNGKDWLAYEFFWKPDRLDKKPVFVAPHQPRLDWQMWFAALGQCANNNWFLRFQRALLEGNETVLQLMAVNPFGTHPPRFVRTTLYRYEFSLPDELENNGRWWIREPVMPYCPTFTLFDGELLQVNR